MKFNSLMHVSFFTDQMDVMRDFYENKLGLETKIVTKAKAYKGTHDKAFSQIAEAEPEKVIIVYIEIAPGQFIELFPKKEGQEEHDSWNQRVGYTHYALLVDDIYQTRKEMTDKGIVLDTPISIGHSGTYKMWAHDPDGNKFEIMQYTDKSYQLVGHIDE